jgi:hypothetical protein
LPFVLVQLDGSNADSITVSAITIFDSHIRLKKQVPGRFSHG